MRKLTLVICAAIMVFSACKKKDDDNYIRTKKDILTAGKWKITALKSSATFMGQPVEIDIYSMMDACMQDNLITFNINGTGTTDEGSIKCDPNAPQTTTGGSWALSSDENTFSGSFTSAFGSTYADVVELNDNSFIMKKDTTIGGIASTTTLTYINIK